MAIKRIDKVSSTGKRYHYYMVDGKKADGVTTVLSKALNKPALLRWAPKAVAEWVADHLDEVAEMTERDRDDVVKELKNKPWEQRDAAADRGTEVHKLAERLVKNELVDVPEELAGHVNAYVDFLDTWQPKPILVEPVLANRALGYAGSADLVADIPNGERPLFDLKTSKGVYGNMALQVAAYRYAEVYLDEHGDERSMADLGITSTYIVHVRADGYDVVPVEAGEHQFKIFHHLLWISRNASEAVMKTWLGEPAVTP